jgi:tyrosine-protein phosphatase YwqE
MGEGFTNKKADLELRMAALKNHALIQSLEIKFELIAEYLLDEQFEELLEKDEFLSFGNNHILIETSMNYEFPFVREYIFRLIQKGYKPILAHPERYRYISNEKNYIELFENMAEWGISFQLNMFSLVGLYGNQVKKLAEELINRDLYSYISTDIHHPDQIKFFEQLRKSIFLAKIIQSGNLKNHSLI